MKRQGQWVAAAAEPECGLIGPFVSEEACKKFCDRYNEAEVAAYDLAPFELRPVRDGLADIREMDSGAFG